MNPSQKNLSLAANYATVDQLNDEARIRANNDKAIVSTLTLFSIDYEDFKNSTESILITKQNINDNNLTTNDKTVVGAINELKTTNDNQTTNINQNTTDITYIKENYVQNTDIDNKQDKTDNNLTTNDKTVVGAINELKTTNDNQTTNINQNTTDITYIKENYVQNTDIDNKQDKTDNNLTTNDKTVVGAINELKTTNDNQTTNINQNINDITYIKENYAQNTDIDKKQDKTDNNLTTNDKTVVGAINELKTTNDNQTTNINQNTTDIQEIKSDYLKTSDANNALALKQNINDNTLNTSDKTIPGAINELKTTNDNQTTNINQNINDITYIKENYAQNTDIDKKQDKTDNNLTTNDKTVVGAINELKTTNDNQTTNINQNTTDIQEIKSDYLKTSDANNALALKQNINDNTLNTSDKTIPGAINELYSNKLSNDDFGIFQESVIQYQTITNNTLNNKQNKTDTNLTTNNKTIVGGINEIKQTTDGQTTNINQNTAAINNIQTNYLTIANANNLLSLKQNITDNTLNTTNKTIPGAINELKTNISTWKLVGTSQNARSWSYSLIINKKYRIAFHWNSSTDTTSKIYKEFIWTGNNISLETYIDGFSGVTILGITVLGTANIAELSSTGSGISINSKLGVTSIGRIISLEEQS